jgi:hypothetical protein
MPGTPFRKAVLARLPITFAVELVAPTVQDPLPWFAAGCLGLRHASTTMWLTTPTRIATSFACEPERRDHKRCAVEVS